MGCHVGIDIGAVSVQAAVFADGSAAERLRAVGDGPLKPLAVGAGDAPAGWINNSRRTRGRPVEAATRCLDEIITLVASDDIASLAVAGSGADVVARKLGVPKVNEFKAIATAAGLLTDKSESIFEIGGETSKFIQLRRSGGNGAASIADYQTNGDCAAGTGSFLDQQAGRLHFPIETVGEVVAAADRAARIAGRCSVFAKSDMIHAQQRGYTPAEVLRGLCNAVARNFRSAVFRSRALRPPVAFIGGVAANSAVVAAMREVFELDEKNLFVPAAHAHLVAIGAALAAREAADGVGVRYMADLRAASESSEAGQSQRFPTTTPLDTRRVVALRDRVVPYTWPSDGEVVNAYLGVDVGSVSTNLVVIDGEGNVLTDIYTRTRGRPIEVVSDGLRQIRDEVGPRIRICGVGTTGSGRELIGELIGADTVTDEITCHKTGASFVGGKLIDRVPDTIFEIGGQDSKYISLEDGIVVDFTMNDACAAGTGSFLEERAEELGISIKDEFAALALSSEAPIRLGERCTVFMEHDVNNYMQRGAETRDLVAGLAYSIAHNYINRVVRGRKIGQCIFFQGGTAYNDAVAAAFASIVDTEIIVPPYNGVIGAVGAALLARDKMRAAPPVKRDPSSTSRYVGVSAGQRGTRFRGFETDKVDYHLREFVCKGCSNACAIQEFTVEGEKTYWGDKCSDRYRKRAKSEKKPVIADLLAFRRARLTDDSRLPAVPADAPTVGISLCMYALELLPFYRTLFAACGLRPVLSEPTNQRIVAAGLDAVVAEPCFPVIVAHGHVANLVDRGVDFLFTPSVLNGETRWMHNESHCCPWGQTLPYVLRRSPAFESIEPERWLTPVIRFRDGRDSVRRSLRPMALRIGVNRRTMDRAVAAAFEALDAFNADCWAAGAEAVRVLSESGQPGIVLVGRPYNLHDDSVSLAVGRKLRQYYGVNVIPMDCLDLDDIDVRDANDNMYWNYGRKILAAAKLVGLYENLHIIYVTNFKCGPDSFIKHCVRRASGKPFLTLQFDGHSNDAGIITRCEAYLHSKGFLHTGGGEPTARLGRAVTWAAGVRT